MAEATPTSPDGIELPERAQELLKLLIERYISEGQPVGSRTLSRDSALDLSPATIRNVMADLEELGFLRSPHTSAGRVPTVRGYRLFVDSLLRVRPLDSQAVDDLRRQIDPNYSTTELMQSVSSMLSDFTNLAGVVMLPKHDLLTLRHVEFLPLSDKRILAILVINAQEVQNRIIYMQRDYSQSELQQAANFLNGKFIGLDIEQVRTALLQEMQADRESMNDLMATVIDIAEKTFDSSADEPQHDYVLDGQTNLMSVADLSNVEKLRQLFEAFNQKHDILELLDHCMNARGIQIFIGEEAGYDVLEECSVVTAPYSVDGNVMGVLGVIGPTRMAYDRVIPIVDVTAKLLASALNSRN